MNKHLLVFEMSNLGQNLNKNMEDTQMKSIFILFTLLAVLTGSLTTKAWAVEEQSTPELEQKLQYQVNINTASSEELAQYLHGIGQQKANAIVTYREQNGSFKSVEDLTQIKGIGKQLLMKNEVKMIAK